MPPFSAVLCRSVVQSASGTPRPPCSTGTFPHTVTDTIVLERCQGQCYHHGRSPPLVPQDVLGDNMTTVQTSSFGLLLRRFRLAAALTQEELAEWANLSVRGIASLERGARRAPHRHTVEQLADALNLLGEERTRFTPAARRISLRGRPPTWDSSIWGSERGMRRPAYSLRH